MEFPDNGSAKMYCAGWYFDIVEIGGRLFVRTYNIISPKTTKGLFTYPDFAPVLVLMNEYQMGLCFSRFMKCRQVISTLLSHGDYDVTNEQDGGDI